MVGAPRVNSAESMATPMDSPVLQYTENFGALLEQLGCSIFLTTYQANRLAVLCSNGSGGLDARFWSLPRPMGFAADQNRLALGVSQQIREYRNLNPVPSRVNRSGRVDACYLPRTIHITGEIDIHEMAWAGEELWFVNTRFSCLCTLNGANSFVPRWRPPFVTALAGEDRCHLNGLCLAPSTDGGLAPRYVTAHATSDTVQGWREHKHDGGLLLEVPSGTVISSGLSMPHSPRLHAGRLWVLQSGVGGFGYIGSDGRYESVAQLPGFTRGLDFCGRFAFVGVSEVREAAFFGGTVVAGRSGAERLCGIWIVDISTGQTVGFARFDEKVQEVFGVQVISGIRYPEIGHDLNLLADAFDLPSEVIAGAAGFTTIAIA